MYEPPPRSWWAALREPEVIRAAVIGLVVGLAGSFVGFWVSSSRGLGDVDLGSILAAFTVAAAIALISYGAARLLMHDDMRLVAALLTATLGLFIGSNVAFAVLPGDSTDGTLELAVGPRRPGLSAPPDAQPAKCTWDAAQGSVEGVDSRRRITVAFHVAVTVAADLADDGGATFTIDALAPVTFEPVARLQGPAQATLEDPSGRTGALVAQDLTLEDLPGGAADPTLAEFVRDELELLRVSEEARMSWECPRLP